MKYGELIIENKEYEKLILLIGMMQHRKDATYIASVNKLLDELKSAKRMAVEKIPDDVVRINSTVDISFPDGKQRSFQVVMPEKSNLASNRISLLAPMSLALFGYAAGDEVLWQFPSGMQTIKILKVTQMIPEPNNVQV